MLSHITDSLAVIQVYWVLLYLHKLTEIFKPRVICQFRSIHNIWTAISHKLQCSNCKYFKYFKHLKYCKYKVAKIHIFRRIMQIYICNILSILNICQYSHNPYLNRNIWTATICLFCNIQTTKIQPAITNIQNTVVPR